MSSAVSWAESVRLGLRRGLGSVLVLAKVIVPVYVLVDLLQQTSIIQSASQNLAPLMGWFGLPGEASMVLVAGYAVNLYAAVGALGPLGLGPREVTILGLMLGIAHGLVLETAIIRQVGTRWALLAGIRLFLSFVAGAALNLVMP